LAGNINVKGIPNFGLVGNEFQNLARQEMNSKFEWNSKFWLGGK